MILASSIPASTAWAIVTGLGVLWVILGVWWGRKAKTSEGFMLAGRNVGISLGAATAMATWVTSNTTMVAPLLAYEKGVWGMLAYASASFGLLLFAPLAFRIRRLLPRGVTAGDFFRLRYGRVGWAVFLIITLVYSITWLVTMAIAGGKLLETIGGIEYVQGMSLILVVCVLYTLFGGLYAVIGTDFIQSLIILAGIVFIGVEVLDHVDVPSVHAHLVKEQPALLSVMMPAALLAIFNNMLFGFGEVMHNNVWWSRAFAMREKVAPKAFFLSGVLWFPIPIAAGFVALCAGPLGVNVTDPGKVGPEVAEHVLGLAGFGQFAGVIILVVLFCSMASSIDSLLAATSDLLVRDIYEGVFKQHLDPEKFRPVSATAIIVVSVIAWSLALSGWNIDLVLFSAGALVASLVWPVIAGLFWKRLNAPLVIAGIIAGCAGGLWAYFEIQTYTGALVGAAVSMVFTIAARWVGAKPLRDLES
ncbi:MAG: urea transporter [Akkermansiaceae bacterium]|nr:urea transporter [Akkermansiaceae bacterium]MCP5543790.1 urea transporter [Akkermansiaceae bacterium]MCP5546541.1 urea transporter [Akkermansiaceae bacterium]